MRSVGLFLAAVVAIVLLAGLRLALEHLVRAVAGLPADLLAAGRDAARTARAGQLEIVARGRAALAYGGGDTSSAWDVTAPLVYLLLLAVILSGDVVLASLRFGALLGIPVDGLPFTGPTLDLLTGLLFLAVLATFGCVLLDAAHITPLRRPYGLATGRPARRCWARRRREPPSRYSPPCCSSCGASTRSSGSRATTSRCCSSPCSPCCSSVRASSPRVVRSAASSRALWTLLCTLVAALLAVAAALLDLAVVAVTRAADLLVAGIRLLARPGSVLWNWLADLPVGRRTGLRRLAEPVVEDEKQSDVGLAGGP